jgi:hypothetical protein
MIPAEQSAHFGSNDNNVFLLSVNSAHTNKIVPEPKDAPQLVQSNSSTDIIKTVAWN